jgi:hypothetical protein
MANEKVKNSIQELEDQLSKLQSIGLDNEIVSSTIYACMKELRKLKEHLKDMI